jgi:hypothetical protein
LAPTVCYLNTLTSSGDPRAPKQQQQQQATAAAQQQQQTRAASPWNMANASNIDPDDVVVAELDVVFSNELAGLQSQLVMLQQPLRPNWRAYDAGAPGARCLCVHPTLSLSLLTAAAAAAEDTLSGSLPALAHKTHTCKHSAAVAPLPPSGLPAAACHYVSCR